MLIPLTLSLPSTAHSPRRRQLEHLELYLENGADPNAQDYDTRTPLHIACAERLLTMAQLLIWFGANLHLR